MRLVCISDTHGLHADLKLPEGDVLVHAGDFLGHGTLKELRSFNRWLSEQPHPHKVVIAGNHDLCMQREPDEARGLLTAATYLEDSGIEIDGVRFWGSPYSPDFFPEHWVFNQPREAASTQERWARIPADTDVLIVHGPPEGVLDECPDLRNRDRMVHVGCGELRAAIEARPGLRHVVCGHIHEGRGQAELGSALVTNAASLNERYRMRGTPFVIELESR